MIFITQNSNMRSTGTLARLTSAASSSTGNCIFFNESRTFSSVIFFIFGHTGNGIKGINSLPGFSLRKRWRIPVSVPIIICLASVFFAKSNIPAVLRALSAISAIAGLHSGCTTIAASGYSALIFSAASGIMRLWVGQ